MSSLHGFTFKKDLKERFSQIRRCAGGVPWVRKRKFGLGPFTLGNWGVTAWYKSLGIRIPRTDGYGSRSLDSLSYGVAVCTSEHRYVIA